MKAYVFNKILAINLDNVCSVSKELFTNRGKYQIKIDLVNGCTQTLFFDSIENRDAEFDKIVNLKKGGNQ